MILNQLQTTHEGQRCCTCLSAGAFVLLFLCSRTHAQSINQLDGTPQGTNARAVALGNAYVSETYDVMAMYWNPAAIVYTQRSSLVNNTAMGASTRLFRENIAIPIRMGNQMALSFGIQGNYHGNPWSSPDAAFHSFDVAFAGKVNSTVSFGALLNTRFSSVYQSSLWTGSVTLGAFYFPSPGISYGLAFSGIGWGTSFALKDSGPVVEYEKILPKSLHIGATIRFPSYYSTPDFTLSTSDEKILGKGESIYRAGLEIQIIQSLCVRGGIINLPTATVLSAGIGISIGRFHLDYAHSKDELLTENHFLSLSYVLSPSF